MRHKAEVAVVGAGIIGLATAYELMRRGVDVRVFEAARPGAGQSAGRTRIFRHSHRRLELVQLAVEARARWEDWEQRLGVRLLGREGLLLTGPSAEEVAALLAAAGAPGRLLDERAQAEVMPILRPPWGPALLDELGGSTDVRAAVDGLAAALGKRIILAEVFAVGTGEPAVVETSEGIWEAGRVVLCAGAAVGALGPAAGIEIPLTVTCHARVTFRVREPSLAGRLPALQEQTGTFGETVYAAAFPGEPFYAVGLSGEGSDVPLCPGRDAAAETLVDRIAAYAREALPGLDPDPDSVRLCLQTLLPGGSDNFGVWRSGTVLALAGDNLFKFAPLAGRVLAGVACGESIPAWLVPGALPQR
jgi:glycine/D-amino acid oxidase-like deaminating enzyme